MKNPPLAFWFWNRWGKDIVPKKKKVKGAFALNMPRLVKSKYKMRELLKSEGVWDDKNTIVEQLKDKSGKSYFKMSDGSIRKE
mgnify:CR=1 FL=1|jgi:hypothetical protein